MPKKIPIFHQYKTISNLLIVVAQGGNRYLTSIEKGVVKIDNELIDELQNNLLSIISAPCSKKSEMVRAEDIAEAILLTHNEGIESAMAYLGALATESIEKYK